MDADLEAIFASLSIIDDSKQTFQEDFDEIRRIETEFDKFQRQILRIKRRFTAQEIEDREPAYVNYERGFRKFRNIERTLLLRRQQLSEKLEREGLTSLAYHTQPPKNSSFS